MQRNTSGLLNIMKTTRACAVVITYRPNDDVERNMQVLRCQVTQVIVVDNTPRADIPFVLNAIEEIDGCIVLRQGRNLGIAAALNVGIRYAIERGYEWIATFDQDSQICEGYFEAMLDCYRRSLTPASIGMLYPKYKDIRSGVVLPLPADSTGEVTACLTSGAMMQSEIFIKHGGMEERFYIDYVDYEYCLRLRLAGLQIQECLGAVLLHSLGNITTGKILWKRVLTANHSARRRYYITRNRLVLILRYLTKFPNWSYRESKAIVMDTIRVFLLETDKSKKLLYTCKGIFDGLFGRMGPRVEL